jgi:hypothetical protein
MAKGKSAVPALPDDEQFLEDAAKRINDRLRVTKENVIEIGRELMAVKERLGHGNFQPWIEAECGISQKTAERYMQVAHYFTTDAKIDFMTIIDVDMNTLYELAAPSTPEEVRSAVEDRLRTGDEVTAEEVRELKRKAKERAKAAEIDRQLQGLREELERLSLLDEVDTYKAAIMLVWNAMPRDVREWLMDTRPAEVS